MADKSRVDRPNHRRGFPETNAPGFIGQKADTDANRITTDWVATGAKYAEHWAYVKPTRPEPPEVSDKAWGRNAVDHFILARLDREHLKPSARADRYTLIRRVSLDLTGLPLRLKKPTHS